MEKGLFTSTLHPYSETLAHDQILANGSMCMIGAGELVQMLKVFAEQAWQSEFDLQNSCEGER